MSDQSGLSTSVTIALVSGLLSIGASYVTARMTTNSAIEVSRTEADAAIQSAKEAAQASIETAKAANRVEMAKLAITFVNDKSTPPNIRAWALQVLAECTGVPLTPDETADIVKAFSGLAIEQPGDKVPWQLIANPKVEAIVKGLKADYSNVWDSDK
ncbi:MAG: hypothetical protein EOR97_25140 [Mesorhizobium sp.]|uniref:hypothetical protein n=1 Tax=Mesorhizobium sp. TaxID=1871066 RepID=UPI000FE73F77|nr:hypothetical protein [Mesorhizobium sp.]RWN27858.1 MAG: hypothetical protein EOR97_25140 [Mesorhizobium sp.]